MCFLTTTKALSSFFFSTVPYLSRLGPGTSMFCFKENLENLVCQIEHDLMFRYFDTALISSISVYVEIYTKKLHPSDNEPKSLLCIALAAWGPSGYYVVWCEHFKTGLSK